MSDTIFAPATAAGRAAVAVVRLSGPETRAAVRALAGKLPASASADYGTPFYETFQRYHGDFYKIDPQLFSPAEVWLTSATTGETFHGGHLNPEVLRSSLYG